MFAYPGRAAVRQGLTEVATAGADPLSIAELVEQDAATRLLLMLTADGNLSRETGSYSFSTVLQGLYESALASTLRMSGVTQFGREYMAFAANGLSPISPPLAYDGTNTFRVSPSGPGEAAVSTSEPGGGSISAGVHSVAFCFLTSWGYITPPTPLFGYTASGSKNVQFTSVPTGPSWVTARIVCFSAVGDTDLYFIDGSSMVIPDNTTTTVVCDFTDDSLVAGTPISVAGDPDTDLNNLQSLGAQSFVFAYHNRLVWVGERAQYSIVGGVGPRNVSFDGGWSTNRPLGWTEKVSGESKGSGIVGATGEFLKIVGNGAGQQGCLENQCIPFNFIKPGSEVRARIRIRKKTSTTGTFHILAAQSAGASTSFVQNFQIDVGASVISTDWRILDGQVLSAANNTLTSSWRLRISGGGSGLGTVLSNSGEVYVDWIEFYNGAAPTQPSIARISKANQPDAYDATTGFQYVDQDNGQRATSGFVLNETCYYVKERSLYSTRDDGAREPAFWTVSRVSNHVGSPSAKGVGIGDNWVAIAGRAGLYYFDGGRPILLSKDFRKSWRRINWQYASQVVCRVDMDRQMILVAAPIDAQTTANTIFCVQWIGDSPISNGSGSYFPQALNFNFWTTAQQWPIYDMATSERSDGTRHFLLAAGTSTARDLLKIDDSANRDHTSAGGDYAISAQYRTAFMGDPDAVRLATAVRAWIGGTFTGLNVSLMFSDSLTTIALPGPLASAPAGEGPMQDFEWPKVDFRGERVAVNFQTSTLGDDFSLAQLAILNKSAPHAPLRGRRN